MAVLSVLVMFPNDPKTGTMRKDLRVGDLLKNVKDADVPTYLAVRGQHSEKHWGLTDYPDDLTKAAEALKPVTEALTKELTAEEAQEVAQESAVLTEVFAAEEDKAIAEAIAATEAPAAEEAASEAAPAEEAPAAEAEEAGDKPRRGRGKNS